MRSGPKSGPTGGCGACWGRPGWALVVALVAGGAGPGAEPSRGHRSRHSGRLARGRGCRGPLVERQPAVGLLLAAEAFRRQDSADTRSTLLAGLEVHPLLAGLLYGVGIRARRSRVFTPDGKLAGHPDVGRQRDPALGHRHAEAGRRPHLQGRHAARRRGEPRRPVAGRPPRTTRTAIHPEIFGSRLEIWDLPARKLDRVLEGAAGFTKTSFSADGSRLVTQGGPFWDSSRLTAQVWGHGDLDRDRRAVAPVGGVPGGRTRSP